MGIHLTARLAWHDDGWNGHVWRKPTENTYCIGCYSYPGQMVAERRDLEWEKAHAGQPIDTGEHISPYIYSANAFADPPNFFKDATQTRKWDLPPASVCVWPYEVMYAEDIKQQGQAKPLYPDMMVFRREGNKVKIDTLNPHDDARADAAEKAVGLADFARKHGAAFGRIEMIRVAKGQIQRLRLHQESVRDKVLKVTDLKHLAEMYGQHG